MDPMEPSPRKEKDHPSSAASKVKEAPGGHGVEPSSNIPSWPSGRPRSHLPQRGLISAQCGTLPPSGWYTSGGTGQGRLVISSLLGSHLDSDKYLLPAFLPPKKRAQKSLQLQGHLPNGPHNYSMQCGRISTAPPRSPAATMGSKSQAVTTQSAHPPFEYSTVEADKNPHNNPRELVKMPQISQPNKSLVPGTLSTPHNTALTFHAMKTTSAQPQLKGFDADVTIGSKNDNYSSQPVMSTTSVESHLKDSNADVNQSDGHEDLWSALRGLTDARKRLRGKDPTPIVEEVTNVDRKKTRLGWGKGLAKYEKEQKEKELLNAAAIEISGVLSNSSTKATEIVTCPDSVPAFSCGSTSPSYGAMPVIGDQS